MIEACDTDSRTLYRDTSPALCAITRKEIGELIRGIEEDMTEEERAAATEQSEGWEYAPLP